MKLHNTFKELVTSQTSWTKWHVMDQFEFDYQVAEAILEKAVKDGLVMEEDYYNRYVVIK